MPTPIALAVVAAGAATPESGESLIASPDVDAVVICSPDFTHAELVLACLEAEKPVMCEKPLALTIAESAALVDAEVTLGRRLVQVGFMRRYDTSLSALRDALRGGELGAGTDGPPRAPQRPAPPRARRAPIS